MLLYPFPLYKHDFITDLVEDFLVVLHHYIECSFSMFVFYGYFYRTNGSSFSTFLFSILI